MSNPAHGHWKEDETNWSEKDTAFIDATITKNHKGITMSFKDIKGMHESLPY